MAWATRVLQVTAERVSERMSSLGEFGRLGGDRIPPWSFAAAHTSLEEIAALMADVVSYLTAPMLLARATVEVSACIGVAIAETNNAAELLRRADLALATAKRTGAGTVQFYDEVIHAQVQELTDMEHGLRHAMSVDSQLSLVYQPIVDSSTSTLSAEALLRWNRPGHRMVPPTRFIIAAEQSQLIERAGSLGRSSCAAANRPLVRLPQVVDGEHRHQHLRPSPARPQLRGGDRGHHHAQRRRSDKGDHRGHRNGVGHRSRQCRRASGRAVSGLGSASGHGRLWHRLHRPGAVQGDDDRRAEARQKRFDRRAHAVGVPTSTWCVSCARWRRTWACPPSPKASRPRSSSNVCATWDAAMCRDTTSPAPCRPTPSRTGLPVGCSFGEVAQAEPAPAG